MEVRNNILGYVHLVAIKTVVAVVPIDSKQRVSVIDYDTQTPFALLLTFLG